MFDAEQAWTVLDGTAEVTVDGETVELLAGDTLVIPGAAATRIVARAPLRAVVAGRAGTVLRAAGREPATPPWIA